MASRTGRIIVGTLGTLAAVIPSAYALKKQTCSGFTTEAQAAALPWSRTCNGKNKKCRSASTLKTILRGSQMAKMKGEF